MPHDTHVRVRLATADDRPLMDHLWLMFRHDMSEFSCVTPGPDGTFRSDRLEAAFADADRVPYLLTAGQHPVGLPSYGVWPGRSGS